jgi:hypothetical protein
MRPIIISVAITGSGRKERQSAAGLPAEQIDPQAAYEAGCVGSHPRA